eukprot:scpid113271/ scgid34348/ 
MHLSISLRSLLQGVLNAAVGWCDVLVFSCGHGTTCRIALSVCVCPTECLSNLRHVALVPGKLVPDLAPLRIVLVLLYLYSLLSHDPVCVCFVVCRSVATSA